MKKLVLLLAVAFSVSMFSCGGGDEAKKVDSDSIKKAEAKADSIKKAEAAKKATDVTTPATDAATAPTAPTAPTAE